MLEEVTFVMPDTTYDLIWYVFATIGPLLIVAFATLVWFLAKRIISKLDSIEEAIVTMLIKNGVTETKLEDHVKNEAAHCKGMYCQARAASQ